MQTYVNAVGEIALTVLVTGFTLVVGLGVAALAKVVIGFLRQ